MIIHVSGPSGSGKTTLGKKLKKKFGNRIRVKDIDDLRAEFVKKHYGGYDKIWSKKKFTWDKKAYQKHIDAYVKKIKTPLVLVGLNHMPWWGKNHYYGVHSTHNFYIKLPIDTIFEQKCIRYLNILSVYERVEMLKALKKNEKQAVKVYQQGFASECSYELNKKQCAMWNKAYKNQKYKFMTREKILAEVSKLIRNKI